MPLRLGAVSYLNTLPLVFELDRQQNRFALRFDVPSRCAALLHDREVDLGLIPSIEYARAPDYRIVPDISIASSGPVSSVAMFTSRPIDKIRSIAVDTSSRTSVALLRVLCARWFHVEPVLREMPPDVPRMLRENDAALVIGDNALFLDPQSLGVDKIDLGEQWSGMTGLPFVYAFWAGRAGAIGEADIRELQATRDRGVAAAATIARRAFPGDPRRAEVAVRYLQSNVKYALGEPETAGLRRFYELASEVGVIPKAAAAAFYPLR